MKQTMQIDKLDPSKTISFFGNETTIPNYFRFKEFLTSNLTAAYTSGTNTVLCGIREGYEQLVLNTAARLIEDDICPNLSIYVFNTHPVITHGEELTEYFTNELRSVLPFRDHFTDYYHVDDRTIIQQCSSTLFHSQDPDEPDEYTSHLLWGIESLPIRSVNIPQTCLNHIFF